MCEAMHEYVGKDITNEVCGCEEPTERPIISMMYDGNNNLITYDCHRCNRKWEGAR